MKKIVSLLLVILMAVGMLTACAPTENTTTPEAVVETESAAPEESTAETEATTAEITQPVTFDNLAEAGKAGYEWAKANGKKYKIGVSWYSQTTEFMACCKYYMQKYVDENYGDVVELVHLDGDANSANQLDQISNLIAQGCDAILHNPFDKEQNAPGTLECYEAGIPCIEFNCSTTVGDDKRTTYVGSDHVYSGELLAEALVKAGGENAKWLVIDGVIGQDGQIGRIQGMNNVLANYPGIEIVGQKACNWVRDEAIAFVENAVTAGLEFDVVFALCDDMGLGAQIAVKDTPYEDKVVIGSVDGLAAGVQAVRDGGNYYCTVFQNGQKQAEGSLDAALAALAGYKIDTFINVPYELVTAENVDDPAYDTSEAQAGLH